MEVGMAALSIRRDRSPVVLRKLAKAEADARVARRMLAIANALDGMSREDAAQSAGMDRQTLRDWVIRYNVHGLDGLADQWGDGRPPKLSPEEKTELVAVVLAGPDPEASGISAFTREDRIDIHFLEYRSLVFKFLSWNSVKAAGQVDNRLTPVILDHANHHVLAAAVAANRFAQHRVSFANSWRIAKEKLENALFFFGRCFLQPLFGSLGHVPHCHRVPQNCRAQGRIRP